MFFLFRFLETKTRLLMMKLWMFKNVVQVWSLKDFDVIYMSSNEHALKQWQLIISLRLVLWY